MLEGDFYVLVAWQCLEREGPLKRLYRREPNGCSYSRGSSEVKLAFELGWLAVSVSSSSFARIILEATNRRLLVVGRSGVEQIWYEEPDHEKSYIILRCVSDLGGITSHIP